MAILTMSPPDRAMLADALARDRLVLACLCAAWCDTCTAFRAELDALASDRPEFCIAWIDIEDDAALAGDVDVENFPTLLVMRGAAVLHYGVSLPHVAGIARLLDALRMRTIAATGVPDAVTELARALARRA